MHVRPPAAYFTNIADDVGLGGIAAKRVLWIDLDGDTYADCILGDKGVFLNRRGLAGPHQRVFVAFADESNLYDGGRRVIDAFQAADIDNDGDIDLFAGKDCDFERPKVENDEIVLDDRGRPVMAVPDDGRRSEILLNDGTGRFSPAPVDILRPNRPERTTTATFLDYDNDGFVDLFIGNWYRRYGLSYECYPSRLFRNLGGRSFVEVTADAGLMTVSEPGLRHSSRPVYGTAHCDFNNDGWQDILVCAYG